MNRFTTLALGALVMALLFASLPAFAIVNVEDDRLTELTPGFNGKISLSGDLTGGNQDQEESSYSAKLVYLSEAKSETMILYDREYARAEGVVSNDNAFVHLRHTHPFTDSWSWEVFHQQENDKFFDLLSRKLTGAGLRYTIGYEPKTYAHYLGIGAFQETEEYQDYEKAETNRLNLYWSYQKKYESMGENPPSAGIILYYQPSFEDSEDYRGIAEPFVKFSLTEKASLSLSYEAKFDSRPLLKPEMLDYTSKTSLEYKF